MAKLRKMLGTAESPYIGSLMRLIETQSKETIAIWCINYAEKNILPIYEEYDSKDTRLKNALEAARDYIEGKIKLVDAKKVIREANSVAKEWVKNPVAEVSAKTIVQAVGSIHRSTHSLGMAFYGAAAIAYHKVGLNESSETYDKIASNECEKMEQELRNIAIENEENPAKINWNC